MAQYLTANIHLDLIKWLRIYFNKKNRKYSKFFRNCVESIPQYMLRLLTVHKHFNIWVLIYIRLTILNKWSENFSAYATPIVKSNNKLYSIC